MLIPWTLGLSWIKYTSISTRAVKSSGEILDLSSRIVWNSMKKRHRIYMSSASPWGNVVFSSMISGTTWVRTDINSSNKIMLIYMFNLKIFLLRKVSQKKRWFLKMLKRLNNKDRISLFLNKIKKTMSSSSNKMQRKIILNKIKKTKR